MVDLELEDSAGYINFYLTITALAAHGNESNIGTYVCDRQEIENEFTVHKTWKKPNEVGWLQVFDCNLIHHFFLFKQLTSSLSRFPG